MKLIKLAVLILISISSFAQSNKLLIEENLISDWSKYPIYQRLISDSGVWKNEFKYLDSIDVSTITYLSDGLKIKGLIAKPKSPGIYPCIIYNRGGNRDFGALKAAHAAFFLGKLAKEGYVVIASQYRGNAGSEGKEEFGGKDVNDVLVLTEVLKEVKYTDTNKIGMYGWSRGGMMTYIALTKSDKIKAAVVGGANSNLTQIDRPEMESNVYQELIPNYSANKEEELMKRSAIFWVDKFPKNIPILLLHGNSDWRVKSTNSLNLALKFDEFRIPYKLIIYEGADHGITEFRTDVDKEVAQWFNKYLKNYVASPNMEYHGR